MKIVFFDIDGTIYHLKEGVPKDTSLALKKLRENGIKIGVCTSRSSAYLPFDDPARWFDVIITSNGSRIQIGDKLIRKALLRPLQIDRIVEIANANHLVPVLCGPQYVLYDQNALTPSIDPWILLERRTLGDKFLPLSEYHDCIPIDKICIKVPKGKNPSLAIHSLEYINEFSIYIDNSDNLDACSEFEVMPAFSTKGEGIKSALVFLDIMAEDACAFGDGMSDLSMFEAVRYSVAMGNATCTVKDHASHVTSRYDEGGITEALRYYGLLDSS